MIPCDRAIESSLPAERTLPTLSDREFALFQSLIYQEAGIFLGPAKKALLVGRLARRLRDLGLASFGAYYRRVADGDARERVHLIDSVCTNETHFFREPRQFEFLEQRVFPEWKVRASMGHMPRKIRVWSAACSTGEEPYSLAMMLLTQFPPATGWEIEILASDLSTRALEKARAGVWPVEKAKEIPPGYLKLHMLKGTRSQEGKMKVGTAIRSLVRFERINLNDETYPVTGLFDLIFCRNVLIYFDSASKQRVVHRLVRHLSPAGYLFLGHAESLNGLTDRIRSVIPTVHVHAGEGRSAATAPICSGREA